MTSIFDCDQSDDRETDAGELAKLAAMNKAFGFHGIMMLSKPCPKCNGLHHWRMITTFPPHEQVSTRQLLRHAADMMEQGDPELFDIGKGTSQ